MTSQGHKRLVDFLIAPYELRSNFASDEELVSACKEGVKQLVRLALEKKLLPTDTLMIQFAHVSALDDGDLSFEIPPAVKRDLAEDLLRAGVFHAAFVKMVRDMSLFRELAEKFSHNATIIFTKGIRRGAKPSNVGLAEVVFDDSQLPPSNVYSIDISAAATAHDEICDDFVLLNNFQQVVDRYVETKTPSVDSLRGTPTVVYDNQEWRHVELLNNPLYQFHISPLVRQGHVVICAPRIFQESKSAGGGCLFVTKQFPSDESLEAFQAVSHKILNLIAGYQTTAQRTSRQTKGWFSIESLGMMKHSLGHTISRMEEEPALAQSAGGLERFMIDACIAYASRVPPLGEVVDWDASPFSPSHSIRELFFRKGSQLTLEDSCCSNNWIDVRFVGLIIELSRNLYQRRGAHKAGRLTLSPDKRGHVSVNIVDHITVDEAFKLYSRAWQTEPRKASPELRGIPTVLLFAEALADRAHGGMVECCFEAIDANVGDPVTHAKTIGRLRLKLSGPAAIFDRNATLTAPLNLKLTISGLMTTRQTTL